MSYKVLCRTVHGFHRNISGFARTAYVVRPNVPVCNRGAAHEVYHLPFTVLRHDLTVDAWRRTHVEHVNVDSIGACGSGGVVAAVAWMKVANDTFFTDIDVSGSVGVLRHGSECAVSVVFDNDGDMIHALALPKRHITVNGRIVG